MIIFVLLIKIIHSQMNITSYVNYPQYFNPSVKMFQCNFGKDGKEILVSLLEEGIIKITKLNVEDPSNVYKMGEYRWSGQFGQEQDSVFRRTYFYSDYLIACSFSKSLCKIFNYTSFAPVGVIKTVQLLAPEYLVQSKGIYIFGTRNGRLLKLNSSTFPNLNFEPFNTALRQAKSLKKSPDQNYLAVTYKAFSLMSIFNLTDLSLVKTFNLICSNSQVIWSFDNRFLILIPFTENYLIVYNRTDWSVVHNISIEYINVANCYPHQETNSYLCIVQQTSTMFSLNLYDYSVDFVFNGLQGSKFRASQNNQVFLLYNNQSNPVQFYQFNKYCTGNTFYHIPQKACIVCDTNCAQCLNTTACEQCTFNYTLINGKCKSCGMNELYNSSTKLCDDISTFCSGDKYFSIPLSKCVQCLENCQKCLTTTVCSQCQQNYIMTSQQTCISQANYYFNEQLNQKLENLMGSTLKNNAIQGGNTIPGNRILFSHIFSFFSDFGHLWLYNYHKRSYGPPVFNFLYQIRNLEEKKWNSVSEQFLSDSFNINWRDLRTKINFKQNETSWKFLEIEKTSSSFFVNTIQYFMLNVPLVFMVFIVMRFLFFVTFKYQISIFFREYAFKLFFVIMLMEGNIQSFIYYMVFDCLSLYHHNPFHKIINILMILCFFCLCFYVMAWYFIVTVTQKQNSKYFFGNYHSNFKSLIHLTFESNILNLCLGACHILLQNCYELQLGALTCTETGYILWQVKSIRKRKVYHLKYIGWQNIFMSLLRISLIGTFSFDRQATGKANAITNEIQMIIIMIYLLNSILSISFAFLTNISSLIQYLAKKMCPCRKNGKRKQKSQHSPNYIKQTQKNSICLRLAKLVLLKQGTTMTKCSALKPYAFYRKERRPFKFIAKVKNKPVSVKKRQKIGNQNQKNKKFPNYILSKS